MADFTPHTFTSAGVLFCDPVGRPMLVKTVYKDGWEIPGGFVEPGEPPAAAAAREIREELALTVPIGRLLVVDWSPVPRNGDILLFVFDGGQLPASRLETIQLQPEELCDWRFVEQADLDHYVVDRLARRIRLALKARAANLTIYAEQGYPLELPPPAS